MNDIAALSDRVLVIDHGRLVMNGSPREVFARGEELEAIGLDRPEGMRIADALRAEGLPIEGAPMTMEETADIIAAAVGAPAERDDASRDGAAEEKE